MRRTGLYCLLIGVCLGVWPRPLYAVNRDCHANGHGDGNRHSHQYADGHGYRHLDQHTDVDVDVESTPTSTPTESSQPGSVGSEFQVDVFTTSGQFNPSVAVDADGDFVVAWQSGLQDGSSAGIFARRFSLAGAALATEFQVNEFTPSIQASASVATDVDGDFVVTWQSYAQEGPEFGVFARRFRVRAPRWDTNSRSTLTPSATNSPRRWRWTWMATSSSPGRATTKKARPRASSPAASPARELNSPASSRSTVSPSTANGTQWWQQEPTAPSWSLGRARDRTVPALECLRAVSRAPARPWRASSRSTNSRWAHRSFQPSRRTPTAISSLPGAATVGRRFRPSILQHGRGARRRVHGQYLCALQPEGSVGDRGRRRGFRRRLA